MESTLIIGYGNSLRGDDGAGYVAAERLAEIVSNSRVRVVARQQLTPELAAEVSETDRVILIDAAVGHGAGCIFHSRVEPSEWPPTTFIHNLDPAMLLACSKTLYGRCPETCLVSIIGESFEFGDGLSTVVAAAIPEAVRQVLELIARHGST